MRYTVVDLARAIFLPRLVLGEYAKAWWYDEEFFRALGPFERQAARSAERKFFLRSLLGLVRQLPGDTAEAGVFEGASSWFICETLASSGKRHYAFDSFEGLSAPTREDGHHWKPGEMETSVEAVRRLLAPYNAEVHKGWIPDCFEQARVDALCFAHIDVDLYEPTLKSIGFFYPRMVPGGVILCDDYGSMLCPGAKQAIDEYLADKPEEVVHTPTAQGFLIKRG